MPIKAPSVVAVECTHCSVSMRKHEGGGGTISYFHCPSCQRWTSSMYTDVFRADTKMRPARNTVEASSTTAQPSTVKERLAQWLSALSESGPYSVLGSSPLDTDDQVRARYLALAKRHHPDAGGDAATMRKITEAYHHVRSLRASPASMAPALAT
jgi:hypothetical protein